MLRSRLTAQESYALVSNMDLFAEWWGEYIFACKRLLRNPGKKSDAAYAWAKLERQGIDMDMVVYGFRVDAHRKLNKPPMVKAFTFPWGSTYLTDLDEDSTHYWQRAISCKIRQPIEPSSSSAVKKKNPKGKKVADGTLPKKFIPQRLTREQRAGWKTKRAIKKAQTENYQPRMAGIDRQCPGFIYIMFNPDTKLCKIGLSKRVDSRLREVQFEYGDRVRLVYWFPVQNMAVSEHEMHQRFMDKHVYGEWFRLVRSDIQQVVEETYNPASRTLLDFQ